MIGKTESADLDMEYFAERFLGGYQGAVHRNPTKKEESEIHNKDLPLFEQLADRDSIVAKFSEKYKSDMTLFGYTLRHDKETGFLRADCEQYASNGMCC